MKIQKTFWNANDTDQHVTLYFSPSGLILWKSRDTIKAVREEWPILGTWHETNGTVRFTFRFDVPHLGIAVTHLLRSGARVTKHSETRLRNEVATVARTTDRETDPRTFLGSPRKRSIWRPGEVAYGEAGARRFGAHIGPVDVAQMRRTMLANRVKRR